MKRIFAFILLFLMLAGCGQQEKTDSLAAEDVSKAPVSEEQLLESASVRPEKSEMRITVQSKTEVRPVELYVGQGYSIYITEDGWHLDRELEDGGILEDIWESALHGDDAELKVKIYPGVTAEAAKSRFAAEEDDFSFESQLTGDWGDPMRGRDEEDKKMLHFMVMEGNGNAYIISWHYADRVADLYGAQLRQMADTFLLTEE